MLKEIKSKKFIRFLVIGGCSTLIDFIIYYFLSNRINVVIAKALSMIIASIFSFIMNKTWTFSNKSQNSLSMVIRFYIVLIINIACNTSINYIVLRFTNNKYISFVVATAIAMLVNYILQKLFVFDRDGQRGK